MAFGFTRDGHVIPGSGNRGFGRSHFFSSPYILPPHHSYHSPSYYRTTYYCGPHGLLGGGISLLVLGVALAAIGIFSFFLGDPPLGITFTALGGLGILAGIACLIARFANKKFN